MSISLILRPTGRAEKENKPWSLQLRYSGYETDYLTLAHVSDDIAQDIIKAGAADWLFGEPDWAARERERELERARVLEEQAAKIRNKVAEEQNPPKTGNGYSFRIRSREDETKFFFEFMAPNGVSMATSSDYNSYLAAIADIETIKSAVAGAEIINGTGE